MKYYILSPTHINDKNYRNLLNLINKNSSFFDEEDFLNFSEFQISEDLIPYDLKDIFFYEILSQLSFKESFHQLELIRDPSEDYKKFIYDYCKKNHSSFFKILLSKACKAHFYFIKIYQFIIKTDIALIFNGFEIKDRVFCKIFGHSKVRIFHTEYLFTGQHFFMYNTIYPIPNKFPGVERYKNVKNELKIHSNELAYNFVANVRKFNLNVKSNETEVYNIDPNDEEKRLIIIGQVINDISIFNSQSPFISLIRTYKNIIKQATKQKYKVIFKLHPWEKKKYGKYFTDRFLAGENITIIYDGEIDNFINDRSFIYSISSQYLIYYALVYKKKCITYKTYFSIEESFNIINENNDIDFDKMNSNLNLDEYKVFLNFINYLLLNEECIVYNLSKLSFPKTYNTNSNFFIRSKNKTLKTKNDFLNKLYFLKYFIPKGKLYNALKKFYYKNI